MRPHLIFVYNADSGLFNTLTDIAHKVFSPDTYECHLCALTYGTFTIREEWRDFLDSLDTDMEFLHRDELESRYGIQGIDLPAVFEKRDNRLHLAVSSEQIASCASIGELKSLILSMLHP